MRLAAPVRELRALQRDELGWLERTARDAPTVAELDLGLAPIPRARRTLYLVNSPDGVEQVLTSRETGKDTPAMRELSGWLGYGLLTLDGDAWLRHRRIIQPLFTRRRVDGYTALVHEEASAFAERWQSAAAAGADVDLRAATNRYTLRVVGRILFGDGLDDEVETVGRAFGVVSMHAIARARRPLNLPRSLPTPGARRAVSALARLHAVVDSIVADSSSAASPGGTDLVSLLLAARDPRTGERLTLQEVRDEVLVFLLAGHETTSTALAFALHLLGRHPRVQQQVRAEVSRMPAAPQAGDVDDLALTTRVVKEALRLYPPAYALSRLSGDSPTEISGVVVPPRSIVAVSPWALHRDPTLWPRPLAFDPDRFTPQAERARHRYAYIPFGGGPRACIGAQLALREAVLAVAAAVRAYELRTPPGPVPLSAGITLRPAAPMACTVRPTRP